MWREIWRHKGQFVSIFLMAFLGVFMYTGMSSDWMGLRQASNEFYEQTALADGFVYGQTFSKKQLEKVKANEGILQAERRQSLSATIQLKEKCDLTLYFLEKGEIGKPYISEGEPFDVNDKEGVWINQRFAEENVLELGDRITLDASGEDIEVEIKGLIFSPEYVYFSDGESMTPNHKKVGFAYLSSDAWPYPVDIPYNELLVISDESLEDIEGVIDDALGGEYLAFVEQSDHASVAAFETEIEKHQVMGYLFPIIFLGIAVLTMLTTMTRMVSNQRSQIGALKALGFSNGRIIRYYVGYGFWISLIGTVLGSILGPLLLPNAFTAPMTSYYTLPVWKTVQDPSFYVVAVAVVALCSLMTFLTCLSILQENPAQTLSIKRAKNTKKSLIEKIPFWEKTGFNARWNVRDVSHNKLRSFMAFAGVFGCTILLTMGFAMQGGMDEIRVWMYEDINHYESKIMIDNATDKEIDTVVKAVSGQTALEGSASFLKGDRQTTGALMVMDDGDLVTPTDANRNRIKIPNSGLLISQNIIDDLELVVGDTVEWRPLGDNKYVTSKIEGVFSDPMMQGILLSVAEYERTDHDYVPTAIYSHEKITKNYPGMGTINSLAQASSDWESLSESMTGMVGMLIVAAAILSLVVLYNLGLLSYTEKQRELATLKVIGFTQGSLKKLLVTQNIWFAILGFIVGLPAGYTLMEMSVNSMMSSSSYEMSMVLPPLSIVLIFVVTVGISILVTFLFSGKIRRIDMAETLKGVE
jgi:putative ABC transport system permease protein